MPRAIILSITTITLIYILTNAAYFAVLTRAEILESDAIAVVFGERAFGFAKWLMPISVALSTMGGLNGSIFAASRVFFAGAREGQLFSALQMIHLDRLTPIPALIFLTAISALYLVTTEILSLINYMTFVEASFAALGVSTVLALRHKFPTLPRPIKVSILVPLIYLAFSFLLLVLPMWTSPRDASIGIAILLTGIPAYYLTASWHKKPATYQKVLDQLNLLTQMLTLSVSPSPDVKLAGIE